MGTAPTAEHLVDLFNEGAFPAHMARRFQLTDKAEIDLVASRCIALHNQGTLDLFELVDKGALQALSLSAFFAASHFFCRLVPELQAAPERMMSCIEALVRHGGDDLASSQPNAAFRSWCAKVPRRALEIIAAAHNGDDLAGRHLTFALEATNDVVEARKFALAYGDQRRLSAITALGRIEDPERSSRAETLATFLELAKQSDDDKVRANLVHAAVAILARESDWTGLVATELIEQLTQRAGEFTLHQCAHVLWAYPSMRSDVVDVLLKALAQVSERFP